VQQQYNELADFNVAGCDFDGFWRDVCANVRQLECFGSHTAKRKSCERLFDWGFQRRRDFGSGLPWHNGWQMERLSFDWNEPFDEPELYVER
jgi:hypothetical protein